MTKFKPLFFLKCGYIKRKIFSNHISNKGLIARLCQESSKLKNKKTNTKLKKKGAKYLIRSLITEDIHVANEYMKGIQNDKFGGKH